MDWKIDVQKNGLEPCGRFYGVYHGIVQDSKDPFKANRLLITIPDVLGHNSNLRIALPRFGIMGKGYGTHFLPKKGAVITVTFRNGDPDYPYWEPGPYENNGAPTEFEGPDIMGLRSRTGHLVSIDDGNNTITVQHKDGYYLEIKEDQVILGNEERVVIKDNHIQLGKANNLEAAVLGDTLEDLLTKLIEEIQQITITNNAVNPVNVAKLTLIKETLPNILANF